MEQVDCEMDTVLGLESESLEFKFSLRHLLTVIMGKTLSVK